MKVDHGKKEDHHVDDCEFEFECGSNDDLSVDGQSSRSQEMEEEQLLATTMSTSFLHTIPEGSSDIVGPGMLNPANLANLNLSVTHAHAQSQKAPTSIAGTAGLGASVSASASASVKQTTGSPHTASELHHDHDLDQDTYMYGGHGHDKHTHKHKRRTRSPSFSSKRKLGIVCSVTLLVVMLVVLILVMIVHNLDHDNDNDNNQAYNDTHPGTNTNTSNHTDFSSDPNHIDLVGMDNQTNSTSMDSSQNQGINDTDQTQTQNEQQKTPSLAPTAEGTLFATASINDNPNIDDILADDGLFADDDATATGILDLLDQAILNLYTSDDPRFNVLADVSDQVFGDPQSHRYQARAWLLNNDTLLQNTLSTTITLQRITQRYIMALFYFATLQQTNQDNNNNNNNNNNNKLLRRTTRRIQNTNTIKFNIQPDIHECYWIDNACGQEGSTNNALATTQTATTTTNVEEDTPIVYLNISDAGLKGTLPFELGYLTELRELCIHKNQLQGTVPELIFAQLQYLYVVDLSQNYFQGNIPTAIWTLPTLRFAYLHGNAFTGTVPQELTTNPSSDLEEIWLRDNQLTGGIPQWWTTLPNLDVLSASNNSWTGHIPSDWSQAQSLVFLDVSVNQLTGTIPPSLLYSVPSLQFLYLDYNQIAGTLPTIAENAHEFDFAVSISRSDRRMEVLWLQNNQLSGVIPNGFAREFKRLRQLELQGNKLEGTWECVEPGTGDDVWPQLQELSLDCRADLTTTSVENFGTKDSGANASSGVDMSLCDVCCIRCF
ncbi:STYKc [Seminavis robusta]|uniref:STYKc n=1 Tax=Seminavis robusta TaxID=568900 RepID=A0A9N8EJR8_9STRA|nr:STYKc [Seminavis robusta]|eukprot:Sro1321_g262470.1 STYKc (775) ;mRNA; f:8573-10897